MRKNLALQKLREGGVISGPSLCYASLELAEEAAQYGFDFVWLEWQHGGWSEASLNAALATFVHVDTVPLVRMLGSDPVWIGRMLDLGALGLIIPMVETAEQCEAIVRAAKFPPRGNRSATGLRTGYHANLDYFNYTANANNEILTIVMVETVRGVHHVREIMSVPGIDCVLIGPYDLSLSMGVPLGDPREEKLIQRVLKVSKDTGVAAGYVTDTPAEAKKRAAQGFRMVCTGHDVAVMPKAFKEMKQCADDLKAHEL